MKRYGFVLFLIMEVWFAGCEASIARAESVSIVNWNLQTFFDGTKDGTEYSDFLKNSSWNENAYIQRLDRLVSSIKLMNADVFVFEEVENEGIIYDIANRLAGYKWNQNLNWNYGCFSKNDDEAIGCAVISRFELGELSVHNLQIESENENQPSMRPIMKLSVFVNGRKLVLFVNHWKSKSGGEEESEVWRNWQQTQLASLLCEETGNAVLCCGDFNRDIHEFCLSENEGKTLCNEKYNVTFENLSASPFSDTVSLYSPWLSTAGTFISPGSYFYNGEFERIDHFFAAGSASIRDFHPVTTGKWCDDNNIPASYKIYSGSGYSDHLPIMCRVEFYE